MSGPTYTYTPDVPQASQPFNSTQSPILNNFKAINELFPVNHVGFNSSDSGKHTILAMPYQTSAPGAASTDITMFVQATPSGPNASEIFYQNPNDGSVVQLSNVNNPTSDSTIPAGTSGTGWCQFSESGLLMKWGTGSVTLTSAYLDTSSPTLIYNYGYFYYPTSSSIPAFTKVVTYLQVNLTAVANSYTYSGIGYYTYVGTGNKTTYFQVITQAVPAQTITFNWLAIGI